MTSNKKGQILLMLSRDAEDAADEYRANVEFNLYNTKRAEEAAEAYVEGVYHMMDMIQTTEEEEDEELMNRIEKEKQYWEAHVEHIKNNLELGNTSYKKFVIEYRRLEGIKFMTDKLQCYLTD